MQRTMWILFHGKRKVIKCISRSHKKAQLHQYIVTHFVISNRINLSRINLRLSSMLIPILIMPAKNRVCFVGRVTLSDRYVI